MTVAEKQPARPRTHARRPSGEARDAAAAAQGGGGAPVALRPPRQPRSEESLAKMLRAGWDLIEQHGDFDGVVISEVIRAAGTSTGAFYGRFKDKDAFIDSVLDAVLVQIRASADKWIETDLNQTSTPAEIAGSIVRFYVDMCRRNRGIFKALLRHFALRDPDANPMRSLDRYIRELAVPRLCASLETQSRKAAKSEIEAALQMVVGTLGITLLTDPGPMRFEGKLLEANLQVMMIRYLQLS